MTEIFQTALKTATKMQTKNCNIIIIIIILYDAIYRQHISTQTQTAKKISINKHLKNNTTANY